MVASDARSSSRKEPVEVEPAVNVVVPLNQETKIGNHPCRSEDYNELVDIKTVKQKEGASRLENAMYFLEQIKTPHKFRVGNDVVELCFVGEESLTDVLAKHINRKIQALS